MRKYANKPFPFIYAALMRFFSVVITGFAALAIVFLLLLTLTTFNVMGSYGVIATAVVGLAALLFFAYFWAAYKGAMIRTFMNAEIAPVHLHDYLDYAIENSPRYFVIFAIKNAVLLLFNLPVTLLVILLKVDLFSPLGWAFIALHLIISFAVKFAFSFTYIAAAVRDLPAIEAVRNGLLFVVRNPVRSFSLYLLYSVVWALLLVPIVDLFVLVSLYPVVYMVMINFYRSKSVGGAPSPGYKAPVQQPPRPAAAQQKPQPAKAQPVQKPAAPKPAQQQAPKQPKKFTLE